MEMNVSTNFSQILSIYCYFSVRMTVHHLDLLFTVMIAMERVLKKFMKPANDNGKLPETMDSNSKEVGDFCLLFHAIVQLCVLVFQDGVLNTTGCTLMMLSK